ncbi:hypothetical protein AG1IA_09311 [Rhizoctonia solani AG-1 IA]|uniref:Uncharacterized protein n=1 Tax=Thanatephorus cucumeris (strain AG1-IA) TaxID=983506 RepID=L8WJX0_THACA|nr:hypothetical protein AG1IA_09311 [Rhizoctonia solani AG-1 IA]
MDFCEKTGYDFASVGWIIGPDNDTTHASPYPTQYDPTSPASMLSEDFRVVPCPPEMGRRAPRYYGRKW